MLYAILSGLGIGLFGSFHCIGMCGPIALSLPLYGKQNVEKLLLIVLYNLGRAGTYAFLGLLFGFAGRQFFLLGYQRGFSIVIGCLMLVLLAVGNYLPGRFPFKDRLHGQLKATLARLLQKAGSPRSFFIVGLANGLLPCGLVYLAAGSAMALGNPWQGAALMFVFGMGTFPLMISIMLFHTYLPLSLRRWMRRLVPVFICFTALLLIARGINLGIPCLSPQPIKTSIQQVKCYH